MRASNGLNIWSKNKKVKFFSVCVSLLCCISTNRHNVPSDRVGWFWSASRFHLMRIRGKLLFDWPK